MNSRKISLRKTLRTHEQNTSYFLEGGTIHPGDSVAACQNELPTEVILFRFDLHFDLRFTFASMSDTAKAETVSFTVKGQVVIPQRIRREFEIENGTRAVVQATPEGILLKPITGAAIKRARGILKRKPGEKPLRQWWAKYKKEEKALEEARYARLRSR
jgi:AbrB family looped-hinge helix DNA binding protein